MFARETIASSASPLKSATNEQAPVKIEASEDGQAEAGDRFESAWTLC
jgi:hypothetical protein